jgi:hypothetical protein
MPRVGQSRKIAEIGGIRIAQALLVLGIDPSGEAEDVRIVDRRLAGAFYVAGRLGWQDQVVLEPADRRADGFERATAAVTVAVEIGEIGGLDRAAQEAAGIVGVEDVEPLPKPGDLRLQAQLPGAEAVEGADPGRRGLAIEEGRDAPPHLRRCLVAEGDGENPVRRDAPLRDSEGHARGERRGLAGSGAGQDQHRPCPRRRIRLGGGQPRQDGVLGGPWPS